MLQDPSQTLNNTYPYPAIRATRITRMEETRLGRFLLDDTTALRLGAENTGVFVGGCLSAEAIFEMLDQLAKTDIDGSWIILGSSKKVARSIYRWQTGYLEQSPALQAPLYWRRGTGIFTTPEGLGRFKKDCAVTTSVAGIILIDTLCHVHKARGQTLDTRAFGDRPQRIADFRAEVGTIDWLPPFFLFTTKPAKSVNTSTMLSPYCLDGWWFLDGQTVRTGRPPNVQ